MMRLIITLLIFLIPILGLAEKTKKKKRGRPKHYGAIDYSHYNVAGSSREQLAQKRFGFKGDASLNTDWYKESRLMLNAHKINTRSNTFFPNSLYLTSIRAMSGLGRFHAMFAMVSNSNRPFHSFHEIDVQASLSYDLKKTKNSRLYFNLFYNSKRSFLKNIPLPTLGYEYKSSKINLNIGVPLLVIWNIAPKLQYRFIYFPVINIRSALSYRPYWYFNASLIFESHQEQFLIAARPNKNQFIFAYHNKVGVKVNLALPFIYVGWRFSNQLYEGDSFSDKNNLQRFRSGLEIQTGIEMALF